MKKHHRDIYTAAWNGELEIVQQLLAKHPESVNRKDESDFGMSFTPLMYAGIINNNVIIIFFVKKCKI